MQALAGRLGPGLVRRTGQQCATIELGGFDASRRVGAGERGARTFLEARGIHDHRPIGPQGHVAAAQHHAVLAAERLPRVMRRLAQVSRAGFGFELQPQGFDDLFARQATLRSRAQQLHQVHGTQAGPVLAGPLDAIDGHREAAEQTHLQLQWRDVNFGNDEVGHGQPSVRPPGRAHNHAGSRERFSKDLPRLKVLATQFFCMGTGGSAHYKGRDLRTAHAGMNISEQELVAAIDDVVAALQAKGIGATEVNEVVAILYSLKGDVLRV